MRPAGDPRFKEIRLEADKHCAEVDVVPMVTASFLYGRRRCAHPMRRGAPWPEVKAV